MKNQKAGILIFVLWVLIILSLFTLAVSYNSAADIKLAKYESDSIKSLYLAKAGIAKMMAELNKDKNNYTSLNEDWHREKEFKFGGGKVVYSASDETARLNLNSPNLNKGYLIRLDLDDGISQRLLDYKIRKEEKGFEFIEELFLIDGITYDSYSKIKPYITIYRGTDPRININTANENVLKVALGNDPIINKIIEFRQGDDAKSGTGDDGVFTEDNFSVIFGNFGAMPESISNYQNLFSVKSDFFRILAEASFSEDKNQTKRIVAVLGRSGKVYYWKEE